MLLIKLQPLLKASGAAVTSGVLTVALAISLPSVAVAETAAPVSGGETEQDAQTQLKAARAQVRDNPSDPKAHFALAELLRKAGRQQEAAQEYLQATDLDPGLYVAYHQLSLLNADGAQLDEAIARLSKLKDEKPKDLLLRVALSELLEKRNRFYQGARVLVDMVYQNAVPDKYLPKVNARIHYLLVKARDSQETEKSASASEEEMDTLPPPLPESTLHKDLSASRLKETRVMRGVGHAPLLP